MESGVGEKQNPTSSNHQVQYAQKHHSSRKTEQGFSSILRIMCVGGGSRRHFLQEKTY